MDLLGKDANDLQSNIAIGNNAITGTLKYVTGYTGFSGDPELQSGNYIALYCESAGADEITVEIVGGSSGAVTLDADGLYVGRIANKNTQSIKVTAKNAGAIDIVKNYSLTGLVVQGE